MQHEQFPPVLHIGKAPLVSPLMFDRFVKEEEEA